MPSADSRPGRPAAAIDRMLRRVPEAEPTQPVSAEVIVALRGGHVAPDRIAALHGDLARDSDARHLFSNLEAEPDERQMRKAIIGAMRTPDGLPQPSRWPWAFGGGGLALAVVLWLTMVQPADHLPTFRMETEPAPLEGLVHIADGRLRVHARSNQTSDAPMRAQLFVGQEDGLHLSPIPLERQADGSFTASAPVRRWFPAHGRYTVHVAVMRPGHELAITGDRLIDRQVGQAGVRWISRPVLFQPTLPR